MQRTGRPGTREKEIGFERQTDRQTDRQREYDQGVAGTLTYVEWSGVTPRARLEPSWD